MINSRHKVFESIFHISYLCYNQRWKWKTILQWRRKRKKRYKNLSRIRLINNMLISGIKPGNNLVYFLEIKIINIYLLDSTWIFLIFLQFLFSAKNCLSCLLFTRTNFYFLLLSYKILITNISIFADCANNLFILFHFFYFSFPKFLYLFLAIILCSSYFCVICIIVWAYMHGSNN